MARDHRRRRSSLNRPSRQSTSRRPAPTSPPSTRRRLIVLLRWTWLAAVVYGEVGTFHASVARCSWPALPLSSAEDGSAPGRLKVLVLADPQLPSMAYTYPDRNRLLRWISLQIIDQYLRKAWRVVVRRRTPDAVVFLGDLLDGGVEAVDRRDYAAYVHRFHRTFPSPPSRPLSPHPHHLLHLAGNHDLGLSPSTSPSRSALARDRFLHAWEPGKVNGQEIWANTSVVWIDSVGLVEERAAGPGDTTSFIKSLQNTKSPAVPRILFSHIPLFRPDSTACGPLRESPRPIRQGSGVNYQNELDEPTSRWILEAIEPDLIFSGDDHDYCVVTHSSPKPGTTPVGPKEVTVKSFSMAMGIQRPGYLLLSLPFLPPSSPPPSSSSLLDPSFSPCLLPSQLDVYLYLYIPLLILSLLLIYGHRLHRLLSTSRRHHARQNGLPIHGHHKSLSRSLFHLRPPTTSRAGGDDGSDEDDGMISDYATYVSPSPTRMTHSAYPPASSHGHLYGHGHASHPSLDGTVALERSVGSLMMQDLEDGMITPIGIGGSGLDSTSGARGPARRTSRMFWADPSPSFPSGSGTSRTLPFASALRRLLGPSLHRSLGRVTGYLDMTAGKLGRHPLVKGGVRDFCRAVGPSAGAYVAVWAWYLW